MNFKKIKKNLLSFTIDFTLAWGTLKLTQEVMDLVNYKEMNEYEDAIDNFVDLMKEQGIENPVEIFDYYNYALWGGYLSNSHEYQYNGVRDLFITNPGLACIKGDGVCLNKADFLASIYKEFGYDAYTVICYVDVEDGLNIDYIRTNSNIDRKIAENGLTNNLNLLLKLLKPVTITFGNHAITCVEYDGEFYYLDPTNLAYLKKIDFNTMNVMNGKGTMEIKYFSSLFLYNLGMIEIFNANDFDYSELLEKDATIIDVEMLEKFYYDNRLHYQTIDDNLKNQFLLYCLSFFLVNYSIKKIDCEILPVIKDAVNKKIKVKKKIIKKDNDN